MKACYLINRILTPLLNCKSPYEMLLKKAPPSLIFEYLGVFVIHQCYLEAINFFQEPILASFLVILILKKGISYSTSLDIKNSLLEMFSSSNPYFLFIILLNLHHFSHSNLLYLLMYYLPLFQVAQVQLLYLHLHFTQLVECQCGSLYHLFGPKILFVLLFLTHQPHTLSPIFFILILLVSFV